MTILIIAEHHHKAISPATRAVVTAASSLGDIHILVAGKSCDGAAKEAAAIAGVAKVLHADDAAYEHFLAENMASLIVSLAGDYSHLLIPSTTFGKNILPRAAAMLGVAQVTDVIEVKSKDTFVHPIYAGNAIETVKTSDSKICLTVRPTAFEKAGDGGSASIETITGPGDVGLSRFVEDQVSQSEGPELTSARVVISGGRGMGNAENFGILDTLAKKIGNAAIGASRAAVDAGYVPNDYQVGQTGKIVAPELYMAVGISGAIQHIAGMKDSKIIVAINKDENAPIFEVADIGLVGDLFDIIPELTGKLD